MSLAGNGTTWPLRFLPTQIVLALCDSCGLSVGRATGTTPEGRVPRLGASRSRGFVCAPIHAGSRGKAAPAAAARGRRRSAARARSGTAAFPEPFPEPFPGLPGGTAAFPEPFPGPLSAAEPRKQPGQDSLAPSNPGVFPFLLHLFGKGISGGTVARGTAQSTIFSRILEDQSALSSN